jgi:hypothetical protein
MRLDASGNLGVGTTTPGLHLDVAGAAGAQRVYLGAADRTAAAFHIHLPTDGSIGSTGTGKASLRLENAGDDMGVYARRLKVFADNEVAIATERLTLDASGNVGVGTTLPLSRLHVVGGTSGTAVAAFGNIGVGTTTALAALHIQAGDILLGNQSGGGNKLYLTSVPTTHYIQTSGTDQWMEFQTATNTGFRFQSTTTPWVSIQGADGNVGIGTVAAKQKLDVAGSASILGNLGVGTVAPRAPLEIATATGGISGVFSGAVGVGTTAPLSRPR